ncbi:hypothetical protein HAP48_0042615 [Bradyrhizobium septentrionale]|uniref:Uncharacterized protein n=1 Tax=Bradyrhizobium septentrionale TaxID=1404411 RepID=A0A973W376_9BRAD|nr:hypothetical protein [Bradyrhizobium septentrionale]UGY15153.1 hypothetical protein HAP48_0042615 [Bradyrhizobium septentrionale]UGY23757.1 hypothetical protein HU675_0038390 [Bradyrhizobium septentrionale]
MKIDIGPLRNPADEAKPLTEESLLQLLKQINRPITVKPTHITFLPAVECTTCGKLCRFDEPYFMCDACERVVGAVTR